MDAAAAQQVFAQRQKLGEDVVAFAHTIKTRAALPDAAGVYCLWHHDTLLYIGESANIRQRWASHHLVRFLDEPGMVITCVLSTARKPLEKALIEALKPRLNGKSWCDAYFFLKVLRGEKLHPDDPETAALRTAVDVLRVIAHA